MPVFSEVTAGVFALVGVVLGGLITSAWSYLGERRRSRTALYVSAFSCLTRWQKVEDARRTKQDSLANEVTHLGRDLDAYMVAIPQLFGHASGFGIGRSMGQWSRSLASGT